MLKKEKSFVNREKRDVRNIFHRFKKRDFSGTSGQALKNSSYQLTQNIVMKLGSLFFTIVIARLLMPELFGLYSLALATIVLFGAFSDLGIGSALITFVSKNLGQKRFIKAKAYLKKLFKWKYKLVFSISILLLAFSYFIANYYYHKPIFYALLVGAIYLPVLAGIGFLEGLFKASNNFKQPLIKEIIFQFLRFTIVPLGIFLLLKANLDKKVLIAFILLLITICYLAVLLFFLISAKKKLKFLKEKSTNLDKKEVKELKKFIFPLSAIALSGVFFGYIDTIMLGHFVESSFLAYYGVAFSLVASASAIISFAGASFFPLFSRLKGKPLEKLFKKGRNLTLLISFLTAIFTYIFARIVIIIAYGSSYLASVPILKYFTILILVLPLSGLYLSYYTSQKRTKTIAYLLISSTILNIILNYVFITYGIKLGMMQAVLGACFATIISRVLYFVGLMVFRRKK